MPLWNNVCVRDFDNRNQISYYGVFCWCRILCGQHGFSGPDPPFSGDGNIRLAHLAVVRSGFTRVCCNSTGFYTGEATGAVGLPGLLTCEKVSMYWWYIQNYGFLYTLAR